MAAWRYCRFYCGYSYAVNGVTRYYSASVAMQAPPSRLFLALEKAMREVKSIQQILGKVQN